MQRLEVSGAVRPIEGLLGVKELISKSKKLATCFSYIIRPKTEQVLVHSVHVHFSTHALNVPGLVLSLG